MEEVHPNDRGHEMVAMLLLQRLGFALPRAKRCDKERVLPKVLFGRDYEDGVVEDRRNAQVVCQGDFEPSEDGFCSLVHGWRLEASGEAAAMKCRVYGKNIFLLYAKGVEKNRGKLDVYVDGVHQTVDTSFENGWGDYAETALLLRGVESKWHDVEIKMQE